MPEVSVSNGIPLDLQDKVLSTSYQKRRDFNDIHVFDRLDWFSSHHSSRHGELKSPGFHTVSTRAVSF